jgi:alpha-galactosidase
MYPDFVYKDVNIRLNGKRLIIANSAFRRSLDLGSGIPRTISLKDAAGREFAKGEKKEGDFSFIGINRPGANGAEYCIVDVSAETQAACFLDSEHVRVRLVIEEKVQRVVFTREYIVYPESPVIAVQNSICAAVMPNLYWSRRLADSGNSSRFPVEHLESCADSISPADGILPVRTVEFFGRTDYMDDQVKIHKAGDGQLNGNLLFCEDTHGAGFVYLQEAPPSSERRDFEKYDFRIDSETIFSCNWGIEPHELLPSKNFAGYRHALILFHDRAERDSAIKFYLKMRFPINPESNHSIMVNPWGCGKFPKLVSEDFLVEEIKACHELGATHYQIDDSWQQGGSLSEIISKNRAVDAEFWKVSDKFHGNFEKLVETAEKSGIELALWMAPSSNCEYRDWENFAELVLDFHTRYGFKVFKVDAVMTRTYEAEENLRKLLQSVREKSDGKIYFNLDTTNGQRPGYFLFLEYGNIFLENRYVCHNWGVGYHPEKTLRSLWNLAQFIRTQSLQIEIPNPGDILEKFYVDRKVLSPLTYPVEYWAAIAMFANPLLWLAPSRVAPSDRSSIRGVMELHRQHRDRIFAGEIFPIGSCPDGSSITGFQSHDFNDNSGYLIFYREFAAGNQAAEIKVTYLPDNIAFKKIVGNARLTSKGEILKIEMPNPATFAMFSY